jgi:hypothetical protein
MLCRPFQVAIAMPRSSIRFRLLLSLVVTCLGAAGGWAQAGAELASRASDIMQKRCMVCHGCYDAPCQLKLEARAGLERGGSKIPVYDGARLKPADPTRLFDDAFTARQWRKKGFFPVLDEKNPEAGLMYRMLELKREHPLPSSGTLPDGFDLGLGREQQCPKPDEFDQFAADFPLWGMPYALPGLNEEEHGTMLTWMEAGAPPVATVSPDAAEQQAVAQWEAFLNGRGNKERLMARYLYEHLFLANIHLGTGERPTWFRLVRSKTPPGEHIDLIATRRPFDDPGTRTFFYRIQRMPLQPLAKIHMPYRLDSARMARYRQLFLEPDYEVPELPDYTAEMAANPFRTFQAMPVRSRYQFLLDEAQFTIMNFIKGPVCRGSVALNVIDDHFWVMFANPDDIDAEHDEAFLAREMDNLRIPTVKTGTPVDLAVWRRYSKAEQRYQRARAIYMRDQLEREHRKVDLDAIWDGGGDNPNAALTVFRHFDSASVVKGFVGEVPKTAWVIGYPLLERIHYLLVANFDVFGPVSHQLESRLYMDFLRFEGENNFLTLMPEKTREELRAHWYRDAPRSVSRYMSDKNAVDVRELELRYQTDDPKRELLLALRSRIYGAADHAWDYRAAASPDTVAVFDRLESNVGPHNSYLPQASFVNVIGRQSDEVYTLLRNSGYSNIAQLFFEAERRLPAEDSVTVARGFLGAYPNYFFMVNESELDAFGDHIADLKSDKDYDALLERLGVHRTDPTFWRISDKFHRMIAADDPIEGGLLDYNRYHARGQ